MVGIYQTLIWQPEIEKLGITHMGLDYIYYRWRTQNGADLTQWEKDGGRNLAHRRCRNIINLFRKQVIPCYKTDGLEKGTIVFFKEGNDIWHVAIGLDQNRIIHNIGNGVEITELQKMNLSPQQLEMYRIYDLANNLYNFKAK